MAVEWNILHQRLCDAFPGATMELTDLVGDQDHYAVEIYAPTLADKSRIEQHRLVLQAAGSDVHALTVKIRSS
jgi:stress-induced morphogen